MFQLVALLVCICTSPLTLLYVLAQGIRQGELGRPVRNGTNKQWEWNWSEQHHKLGLWSVALGELRLLGPQPGSPAADDHPPGLYSPEQLQASMGIDITADDNDFFTTATSRDKLTLLIRSVLAQLYQSGPDRPTESELRIFGVQFHNTTMTQAVSYIADAARTTGAMRRVFFVNADCLNLAYADRDYHFLLHDADLVLPDGSGVRLGLKWLGTAMRDNLNGTDLFPHLCAEAERRGLRLYLLGGTPGIAQRAADNMRESYPNLQIAGCRDGFFKEADTASVVESINESNADILLLGMGAPRQERWLSDQASALKVGAGVGVGGLFDYYSGEIVRAPLWLREVGLEWVWRIIQQPAEKWQRYVVGNPLFLSRVIRQRVSLGKTSWTALHRKSTQASWFSQKPVDHFAAAKTLLKIGYWRASLGAAKGLKRLLDLSVASMAITLLAPLMLVLAAGIKLTSAGPVIYKQLRIGQRGLPFVMYKFRSMHVDAEQHLAELEAKNESSDQLLFKMSKDPRITPIGGWMRRYSLDELPQLVNVLVGTMSLVGPRPALASEVDAYQSAHLKRLQSKPGITCWWQVSGRSDLSFQQQVELDMRYMSQQSMTEDLRLLARTVPAIIGGKGAY